jgi:quinoprotein glucose dehydrogenase
VDDVAVAYEHSNNTVPFTSTKMNRRKYLITAAGCASGWFAGCSRAAQLSDDVTTTSATTSPAQIETSEIPATFEYPWAISPLPDGESLLVTEQIGQLSLVDIQSGEKELIAKTPAVASDGQGGLLDVTIDPDFESNSWVYLTYSAANEQRKTATHLGRGRLNRSRSRLEEFERLYIAGPFLDRAAHYGSRVVFGADHMIYQTIGDRQFKNFGPEHVAQQLSSELGTVIRLQPDGSIPQSNPFIQTPGAKDAIYSYGHRNGQGLARHPGTGKIWESEFGEKDGDEINIIRAGENYGWPIADNSCRYGTTEHVGDSHESRADIRNPVVSWPCGSGGFPPSGICFYTGSRPRDWGLSLLVAGLASRYVARFELGEDEATQQPGLLTERNSRIRDIAQNPEKNELYAAVDAQNAPLIRMKFD